VLNHVPRYEDMLYLFKHHAMKTCGGTRITRWRWMVSFTLQLLYPRRRSPWYPFNRRLGGPQSLSGHGGGEKSLPLPRIEPRSFIP